MQKQPFSTAGPYCSSESRRKVLEFVPISLLCLTRIPDANAVVMENPKVTTFEAGVPIGVEKARKRFKDARTTLGDLIDNFDKISKEGGDNVRRYLGTVGTTSAMYGITKVMKELQGEADDIVEYTENMQDFDYFLRAADTAVYSANFVEFSAASTKPEKYFAEALSDCVRMSKYMDNMAAELKF